MQKRNNSRECQEDKSKSNQRAEITTHSYLFYTRFPRSFLIVLLKISHEDDNYKVILFRKKVAFELISEKQVGVWLTENKRFREEGGCSRQRGYRAPRKWSSAQEGRARANACRQIPAHH